ncbi:Pyrazinamidase/nicotinamidase [Podospora australis]|uniref:nicotinamidase n=1 Tax=Podospora australis TaxID=1536484 RepID=A0AAN6X4N6_9PEZI|nr:Pyrazinamidase/nicotinamidase [Podospora australis]
MAESTFRPALLVVDMQEDFCPPSGSLAVTLGRSLTPLINHLLTSSVLHLRVATQDWHPPNHISFASNHLAVGSKQPFVDSITIVHPDDPSKQYTTRLWPVHCVANTPGAALIPELSSHLFDIIIKKGQDPRVEMYSAFYDPLRVSYSGLGDALRAKSITHVYVVGLAGDYCVRNTAVDASTEGFVTYIVEEGTKCVFPDGWAAVKKEMEQTSNVKVVSVDGPEVGRLFPSVVPGTVSASFAPLAASFFTSDETAPATAA